MFSYDSMFDTAQSIVTGAFTFTSIAVSAVSVGITSGAIFTIFLTFISVLLSLLWVYDVNCTVLGSCNMFAWIKAVFISIAAFGIIWASVASIYRHYNAPVQAPAPAVVADTEKTTTTTVTSVQNSA